MLTSTDSDLSRIRCASQISAVEEDVHTVPVIGLGMHSRYSWMFTGISGAVVMPRSGCFFRVYLLYPWTVLLSLP